ncbi:MAG: bifunctional phosphopantothenoylcysteine decarboxylase/phosphopantothenate--cysteine ligase CoaBC, partial [Myxococcota bacterium]
DLLTTVILATEAPVVVAPAMNTQMWRHPMVQRNIETLRQVAAYHVITPDAGELACKEIGPGRLPDPPVLLDAVDNVKAPKFLAGKKVLVTAGPTREHIDPARFLSNPSTGRMGYALARAAARFGADVTLVTGPTDIDAPPNVRVIGVVSAKQMFDVVTREAPDMDFICKAAAVADWRPKHPKDEKNTKSDMSAELELEKTPDILAKLGKTYGPGTGDGDGPYLVGFAAETHDIVERARAKRERKNAHVIVANRIGGERSAFGADENTVAIITEDEVHEYGPASKDKLAEDIWRVVAEARSRGEVAE